MMRVHAIPESWPLFLNKEQLSVYLGMDYRTITMVCPVRPLDFGRRMVLYHRDHIDAWAATLTTRLPVAEPQVNCDGPAPEKVIESLAEISMARSIDRVRARIAKSKSKCRKKA